MAKLYKSDEQMAIGDGLTIYLRETYPDAPLRHYGSPSTIQWGEFDMVEQDLTPYFDNQLYYTKQAWERIKSNNRQYPPIEDQLDMIYWDKINGTNNWVETITKIKEETPKCPEFVEPDSVTHFEPTECKSKQESFSGTVDEVLSSISKSSSKEVLSSIQKILDKSLLNDV